MKKRVLTAIGIAIFTLAAYAQWSNPANDIPAYNAAPPKGALPPIMAGKELTGEYFSHPYQVKVYQMAAKVSPVLHQLPCYCRCDRSMGHNSLHSCFEGTHGAACSTCMKEAAFAYQQTKLGKTPAQIRAAIERGEWMNFDLEKASL
ncbi:MAG: hypothetical protein HOQ35_10745 [Acidobacteriaceae bacterium]|jgi:hypothetical protein|nr:hypothetical protein [Acidobacteriaceae bacterium]